MENASKALLIAAAVLIVILIIALGMRIFNSTGGATASTKQMGEELSVGTQKGVSSLQGSVSESMIDSKHKKQLVAILGTDYKDGDTITVTGKQLKEAYNFCKNIFPETYNSGPPIYSLNDDKRYDYKLTVRENDGLITKFDYVNIH